MALPTDINPFVQFAGGASGDLGEPIGQSLRFNGLQANVLYKNQVATTINDDKNFTLSTWYKHGDLEETCIFGFHSSAAENWIIRYTATQGCFDSRYSSSASQFDTTASFRDAQAWYHLHLTCTAGVLKLWVNGKQTDQAISIHSGGFDRAMCFGAETTGGSTPADMYLAETYFIQSAQLHPVDDGFIRLNEDGIYVPSTPTISDYGSNGFHLTYDSTQSQGIGHDSSGKGNHFTAVNFDQTALSASNLENDIDYLDTPTANYAILNNNWDKTEPTPLFGGGRNLRTANTIVGQCNFRFPVGTTGKYWVEIGSVNSPGSNTAPVIALTSRLHEGAKSDTNWKTTDSYSAIGGWGTPAYTNFNSTSSTSFTANGPTLAMGIDFDGQQVLMYNNGTLINTDTTVDFTVELALNVQQPASGYNTYQPYINTGQQAYLQSPPSASYKHLQVNNFPTPTIKRSSDHFQVIKARGDSSSPSSVGSGQIAVNSYQNPSGYLVASSDYNTYQAFDGGTADYFFVPVNTDGFRVPAIVFDTPMTGTTFRVHTSVNRGAFYINGTTKSGTYNGWTDISSEAGGSLKSLGFDANSTSSDGFSALEIDGNIVVELNILAQCQAAFPSALYAIKGNDSGQVWYWIDPMNNSNNAHRTPLPTSMSPYVANAGESLAYIWNCPDTFSATGITDGRRNVKAGFSMVKYTGDNTQPRSIPHGLGKKPGWIILWNPGANDVVTWITGLSGTGTSTQNLILNTNEAANNTFSAGTLHAPTDNDNFIVGYCSGGSQITGVNNNGIGYTAFIWAPIDGYSTMGTYTGDGATNGRFIYCGFKPRWVLIKSHSADPWGVYDTERDEKNPIQKILRFEDSGSETDFGGSLDIDILANGFKLRGNNGSMNGGSTYQYVAFAESPFGGENAAPATAR